MAANYEEIVTGLLRKAEAQGVTPEEAETLRDKAYELMTKHSIDQAMIDAKRAKGESTAEEIVTDTIGFTGIYKDVSSLFAHNIMAAFGTMRGYVEKNVNVNWEDPTKKSTKGNVYTLVGYESDVRQVRILIVSLQLQALADLADWWNTDAYAEVIRTTGTPMEKFKARREFIISFGVGAASKIKARMKRAMGDAGPGTEVALRDRGDAVKAWLDAKNLGLKTTRGMKRGDYEARVAGREAGLNADTGEARLGPDRKAIGG
jgi:hypothetical protein